MKELLRQSDVTL